MVVVALFIATVAWFPAWWCGLDANKWWSGDERHQQAFASGVTAWVARQAPDPSSFHTGGDVFDGEWLFGTYQMAALAMAQIAREHPAHGAECLRTMTLCEDRMLEDRLRRFDEQFWGEDPMRALDGPNGHAGYFGYLNLVLSEHRRLDPEFKHRDLNDRISRALARNLARSHIGLIETYPHAVFPVDNAAVAASLRLHDLATGTNQYAGIYRMWSNMMQARYIDRKSGLLIQNVDPMDGSPRDAPRGSGTLLSSYFLGLAGDPMSRKLYDSARRSLWAPALGFGAALEYPSDAAKGPGDIDSGPLVLGRSISGSGLMIACARQHGDEETFRSIYRTVHLFGIPVNRADRHLFVSGGPLGNAMMLALLTAQPVSMQSGKTP